MSTFPKNFLRAKRKKITVFPLASPAPDFDGTIFVLLSLTSGDKFSHSSPPTLDGSPAATRLDLLYTLRGAHNTTAGSRRRRRRPAAAFATRLCRPLVALYLECGFQNASAGPATEPAQRRRLHRPMQRTPLPMRRINSSGKKKHTQNKILVAFSMNFNNSVSARIPTVKRDDENRSYE